MVKPRVLVLRTAGTNCDEETAYAFTLSGAKAELVHINQVVNRDKSLDSYNIMALPGGFTYGDDIASGKILANEIIYRLGEELINFIGAGKLIIGICNGFQVLVKAGILPGINTCKIESSLSFNDSGKFEDRWVHLGTRDNGQATRCVWASGLKNIIYLPVAHGEGKFISRDKKTLNALKKNGQIIFRYVDKKGKSAEYPYNPNGSIEDIAGICDSSGRVLGMMPHPERHILGTQHPRWTREGLKKQGDGLKIFQNGVQYAKNHL